MSGIAALLLLDQIRKQNMQNAMSSEIGDAIAWASSGNSTQNEKLKERIAALEKTMEGVLDQVEAQRVIINELITRVIGD